MLIEAAAALVLSAARVGMAADMAVSTAAIGSHPGAHGHQGHHQGFADAARWAAAFDSPDRDAWQKPADLLAALGVRPGMAVADVGAGTGYFVVRLASAVAPGGVVYATDVEPDMVRWLRDRADKQGYANVVPVLGSAREPRLPPRSCDLVLIVDAWHHVEGRVDYARKLRSALKPGGRVAIVDFKPGLLPVGPPPGMKLLEREVASEFIEAGYRQIPPYTKLPYQYVLVFERK